MKYEEIKIGESYSLVPYIETVIFKHDKTESIMCEDQNGVVSTYSNGSFKYFEPIQKELPEGGLLVSKTGSLVYKLSDGSGYGFNGGHQSDYYFNDGWNFHIDGHWKPATPEQGKKFIEMLKKECEKRGLFEDTKLEKHADGHDTLPSNSCGFETAANATEIWNKNGCIFHKGNFATPLKVELVSKAVKEIGDFTIEQTESGVIILTPKK